MIHSLNIRNVKVSLLIRRETIPVGNTDLHKRTQNNGNDMHMGTYISVLNIVFSFLKNETSFFPQSCTV